MLSYRTRQGLRRFFKTILILALIAAVVWLCWVIWVGRYIVYTPEGAKLDFSFSGTFPEGEEAVPPTTDETISIAYGDTQEEETTPPPSELPIHGYYVEFDQLKEDIAAVQAKLETLPDGTAVLLDVKNIKGFFHYSTAVGTTTAEDVDISAMDALLEYLSNRDLHTIARLPAFRDWEYGLNNVPNGLPKKGGNGSLWMDDDYCYWLNPADEQVLSYLVGITMELRRLGFDEVVFTDFRFPNTDEIQFDGDKWQALTNAAATLAGTCASQRFCVSFTSTDPTFPLPEGNCRLYLENIDAGDILSIVPQVKTDNPALHLLFLTTLNDTRFNDYCVLRPLSSAE